MTSIRATPRALATVAALLLCAPRTLPACQQPPAVPSDSSIRAILRERVESKETVGIVVGVLEPSGSRIISYGASRVGGGGPPLDGTTVFEIGSITKAFTGAVLAEMAARGEVRLEDSAAKYLPPSIRVPSRGGKHITLLDLTTHRSGLPRMPSNFAPANPENPFADYTVRQMYDFLSSHALRQEPGEQYEYSNLGAGLLGHVLATRAGLTYEDLLAERLLRPLGLHDTRITLTPRMRERLATGHLGALPVGNWDLPTLAGAGALRSTANDMVRFLAANLDSATALTRAMREGHRPHRAAGSGRMDIGYGWHVAHRPGADIVWHNGGTGGYHSFAGFDKARRIGVVVLTNSSADIDDIGFHLLDGTLPLRRVRASVSLEPGALDAYLGTYRLAPAFEIVVTREGHQLMIQATNQPKIAAFAESASKFFLRAVDAQITFERDGAGKVTHLILHQNGQDLPGTKVR